MVTIREGQTRDSTAIAGLLNRAYEVERPYLDEPPETKDSVAAEMRHGVYLLAVDIQGHLIGCVLVNLPSTFILKLAVDPALQKRGYGRQLMNEAEQYGKNKGWTVAFISILDVRPELLEYYRRQGYIATGESQAIGQSSRPLQPCRLIKMRKNLD
jgi:GNAT superfamily N-acetyltransferase